MQSRKADDKKAGFVKHWEQFNLKVCMSDALNSPLPQVCHYDVVFCCWIGVIFTSLLLTLFRKFVPQYTFLWKKNLLFDCTVYCRVFWFFCADLASCEMKKSGYPSGVGGVWKRVVRVSAGVGVFPDCEASRSPRTGPDLGARRQLAIDWASRVSAQGHIPLLIEILFTYSSPTKRGEQQSTRANHIWQDGRWSLGAPGGSRPLHSWCTKLPSEGKSAKPPGCSLSAALCSASGILRSELTACV